MSSVNSEIIYTPSKTVTAYLTETLSSLDFPAPVVVEPSSQHDLTVILLHGRGSTSEEFSEDFFATSLSSQESLQHRFPSVRWVFPSAKHRFSTAFQDEMSEWYDVYSLTHPEARLELQKPGLVESMNYITTIIHAERSRLRKQSGQNSSQRGLILGGISMGCAVSIHVLLNLIARGNDQDVRGFFGWCGWLSFGQYLADRIENVKRDRFGVGECMRSFYRHDLGIQQEHAVDYDTKQNIRATIGDQEVFSLIPVFLSHSSDDHIIDSKLGRELSETLRSLGMNVKWKEYSDGGHWIKEPEAMDDFVTFLQGLKGIDHFESRG